MKGLMPLCHEYLSAKIIPLNRNTRPEVLCKKRYSYKFRKIHRETPVSESFLNKVAGLRPVTLLKKRI